MMTLTHFSDAHLGPLPDMSFRELLSKRVTGYVNWQRNRRKQLFGNTLELLIEDMLDQNPDHVVMTGDLVNLATNTEIEAAEVWLRSFADPALVSVVPGNHDAYVPGAINRAYAAWKPWMTGDDGRFDDHDFPYVRIRGEMAIIGLSTATATPPFMASGYFGSGQARRFATLAKKLGEQGLFRVVLIHHPPIRGATANYKRMIGIRRFAAALHLGGAELVLHGHTHLDTIYWLAGPKGAAIPVVGVASASQGHGGHKPPAAYNLFKITGEAGAWRIDHERHRLDGASEGFAFENSAVLAPPAFVEKRRAPRR
ncbi:metallophosphoesterase family protein [Rhizobium sp. TRM95796]|uniref:metallophosphoesterase family protein n=1 Tax=Rhizobium sp. TRM95796 TaxID=2979862 RepID=UPI0021E946F4|nr:metallophosphoesterase [Rhizobium sp. TRM95796]MCV3764860.1 metallophosphoesterase [Rhizobium sp. TRM95796]